MPNSGGRTTGMGKGAVLLNSYSLLGNGMGFHA